MASDNSKPVDNVSAGNDTSLQDAWRQIAGELGGSGASFAGRTVEQTRSLDYDELSPMDQVSLFGNQRTYPCKESFLRLQNCYLAESSKCEQRWKETGKCLGNKYAWPNFHTTSQLMALCSLRSLWKYRYALSIPK